MDHCEFNVIFNKGSYTLTFKSLFAKSIDRYGDLVSGEITISWDGINPDLDSLTYTLEIRAETELTWTLIESNINKLTYIYDTSKLSEGTYVLRITVSDEIDTSSSEVKFDVSKGNTNETTTGGPAFLSGMTFDLLFIAFTFVIVLRFKRKFDK